MLDFHRYIARHGEIGVQAIIENVERYEGLRTSDANSLEERWNRLLNREEDYRGWDD